MKRSLPLLLLSGALFGQTYHLGTDVFSGVVALPPKSSDPSGSCTNPVHPAGFSWLVQPVLVTVSYATNTAWYCNPNTNVWTQYGGSGSSFYQTLQNNGSSQTQRPKLNLIPGSNVTITATDNSGSNSTDVTIASTAGGGGGGTVTVVASGSLTSTALVTGGGTTTVQTPSATSTLDSSGNASLAGSVTATSFAASGSGGHYIAFPQGVATTAPANNVGFQSPTSVSSAFLFTLPAAPAAGLLHATNAAPSVLSVSAVALSDLATQSADTVLMNASGSSATPTAVAMPTSGTNGCAGTSNALTYNTTTHSLGCNSIAGGGGGGNYQTIQNNGSAQTQRAVLNFIPGSGMTITMADNSGNNSTDVTLASSGGGSDPSSSSNLTIWDDFTGVLTAYVASGFVESNGGAYDFTCSGSGTGRAIAGVANHPGIFQIEAANSNSANCFFQQVGNPSQTKAYPIPAINASTGWQLDVVFKCESTTQMGCHVGLGNGNNFDSTGSSANFLGIRFDNAQASDTNFSFVCAQSGNAPLVTSSGVAGDTSWHHLKVTPGGASNQAIFQLDSNSPTSSLCSSSTFPNTALALWAAVINGGTPAAVKDLDIDYWRFTLPVTR